MKKYIILVLLVLLILGVDFYQAKGKEEVMEEAIPIRENEVITGLEYRITIEEQVKENSFTISTHILDSILHYKNLNTIQEFFICLKIDNQSKNQYFIKSIYVIDADSNVFIQNIDYEDDTSFNQFSFLLDQEFFQTYESKYKIQIEFEK